MKSETILAIIVAVVLVLVFLPQIVYLAKSVKTTVVSALSGKKPSEVSRYLLPEAENMSVSNKAGSNSGNAPKNGTTGTNETADLMNAMGYGEDVSWNEVLAVTELDPSTFTNHQGFVKDVRRFSSGANFTSVTDDNTNLAFTNYVGLMRPQHVDIGASARQQPDIDQSVLKRNGGLRWGYAAKDSTYLTAEQNMVPAGQYRMDDSYEGRVQSAEQFVNW